LFRKRRREYEAHTKKEEERKKRYEAEGKEFTKQRFKFEESELSDGETPLKVLAGSRYLLFRYPDGLNSKTDSPCQCPVR
jgi:hypothetical protein